MTNATRTASGRRRNEEARLAILTAAYELTAEAGYPDLTVEGIAARAGAGKQTVYRWWPTKADILLEALALKADLKVSTADQGSFRAELDTFLRDSATLLAFPGVVPVLRSLMAEAQRDADFRRRFQDGFLTRRRAALETIVDRAAARGDKPPHLTPDLAADVVFGLVWYRVLATERLLEDEDVTAIRRLLTDRSGKE
ncbi:MAG: TetR/AcrR family transcriptional regulator [Glycomyces artemisiae]|uniref:TetR family transcriptional regulator n=1 Tax=Glycomyces artemisiae TaxID=1076443 RepID=A0A2T0UPA8_9ACTN|nr:TetR/AcrR family transcriptional regulator [Glycomyces artemisiae]NUQ90643.1 TetR/AcrR family transcriptional regulator [Glycomyces artemisiae]PRY59698.1 TetR family transcriptional regulator [Glycomyces artemisiae]